jgi:hypothetical protein
MALAVVMDPASIERLVLGPSGDLLPAAWVGPLLWLALYPLGQLAERASRAAYAEADKLSRSLTGRELSAPFGEAGDETTSWLGFAGRWLGIAVLLFALCRVIVGLAAQLAQERPIGMLLRLSFGVFLFGNLMVISQRLRNVWFFRLLATTPRARELFQRQEPSTLYWTGLATYLQAAVLLLVAWAVVPSSWLLGGVVGMLLRARRYRQSLNDLPTEPPPEPPNQGAS